MPLLSAYADAIGAVRAEESLAFITNGRVASMPVKKSHAREHMRRLERAANAHRRPRPADPKRLRAAGIGVEFHRGEVSTDG